MQTPPTIACCLCAKPTPSDQCVDGRCIICLAATVDITTGIDSLRGYVDLTLKVKPLN